MTLPWYPAEVLARLSPPPPSPEPEFEDCPFTPYPTRRPSLAEKAVESFPTFLSRNDARPGAEHVSLNPFSGLNQHPPIHEGRIMLRPGPLRSLFDENVDGDAKGIFMCTHGGSILAHSSALPEKQFKEASALGALTFKVEATHARGEVWCGPPKPLKTIFRKVTGGALKALVVEMDGQLLCLANIRESLMAGVLGRSVNEAGTTEAGAKVDLRSYGPIPAAPATSSRGVTANNSRDVIGEESVHTVLDQFLSAQFAKAVGFDIGEVEVRSYRSHKDSGNAATEHDAYTSATVEKDDDSQASEHEDVSDATTSAKGKEKVTDLATQQATEPKGDESSSVAPKGNSPSSAPRNVESSSASHNIDSSSSAPQPVEPSASATHPVDSSSSATHPVEDDHPTNKPEDHPLYGNALFKVQAMAAWLRKDLADFRMPSGCS